VGDDRGAGRQDRRPTKAERKEQARLEREALQAKMAARRRSRTIWIVVATLVVIGAVGAIALTASNAEDDPSPDQAGELPGMLLTEAPWPENTEQLGERLAVLDLPAEGVAQHLHVPLYVFVNGEAVTVPTNLGIAVDAVSPLHTHDDLGTLHVESAAVQDFTLGQAFDVWGVRLTSQCLGGYCESGDARLRVFSGGQETTGDPRDVVLEDVSAVVVTFGTEDDLPDPVPTGFPSGAAPE
jgi:hypothetical protein